MLFRSDDHSGVLGDSNVGNVCQMDGGNTVGDRDGRSDRDRECDVLSQRRAVSRRNLPGRLHAGVRARSNPDDCEQGAEANCLVQPPKRCTSANGHRHLPIGVRTISAQRAEEQESIERTYLRTKSLIYTRSLN